MGKGEERKKEEKEKREPTDSSLHDTSAHKAGYYFYLTSNILYCTEWYQHRVSKDKRSN